MAKCMEMEMLKLKLKVRNLCDYFNLLLEKNCKTFTNLTRSFKKYIDVFKKRNLVFFKNYI